MENNYRDRQPVVRGGNRADRPQAAGEERQTGAGRLVDRRRHADKRQPFSEEQSVGTELTGAEERIFGRRHSSGEGRHADVGQPPGKEQASGKEQAERCSVKTLLRRIESGRGHPCFLLAPQNCGQLNLLRAYCMRHAVVSCPIIYTVTDEGSLIRAERAIQEGQGEGPDVPGFEKVEPRYEGSEGDLIAFVSFVPWLDDEAAQHFSDAINVLVEEGKQVFVSCPVHSDRYHDLQRDRVEVTAFELKQSGLFAFEDYTASLKLFMKEYLPLHLRLVAVMAAVLARTDLGELGNLGYVVAPDVPSLLAELHPIFTATGSGEVIQAERIDIAQVREELIQAISEYLEEGGQIVSISLLAGHVTALSMALLERGDLEASHQVLGFAEELISEGVCRNKPAHQNEALLDESPDFSDIFRSTTLASHKDTGTGKGAVRQDLRTGQKALRHDMSAGSGMTAETVASVEPQTPLHNVSALPVHGPGQLGICTEPRTPILCIDLFGKMEVRVEGTTLENKFLSRAKIRRLLAYLAFNQRRVVLRDNLMEYLWPYLDFDRAQKNLYTSWCMLAKGLGSDKVRECPYIQRDGEIYQLNSELVACDIHQFESKARVVLFGQAELDIQTKSLLELQALYRDSLVADIPGDSFIHMRMEGYRSMMVDSLLLVTRQLRNAGEIERALFCARSAYELDESREDVYRELMDTQLEAGQRTSAMQTYFSCKRYLSDELGILPSKSTTALYQDLLLDNCR